MCVCVDCLDTVIGVHFWGLEAGTGPQAEIILVTKEAGFQVATLQGVWRYGVSGEIDWLGVRALSG